MIGSARNLMRVVHLNTTDAVQGAARAMYRLHTGLTRQQIESSILVQRKTGDDPACFTRSARVQKPASLLRPRLSELPLLLYPERKRVPFSVNWLPSTLSKTIASLCPDIVNLHWINHGFFNIDELPALSTPVVWTLHDMWCFTGGCHYSEECRRFEEECGSCPHLSSGRVRDMSRRLWERKERLYARKEFTVVTPSRWLARTAQKSRLLREKRIVSIPNCLDLSLFKPIPRETAREILNLEKDKRYILFGAIQAADNARKGFHLLRDALKKLVTLGAAGANGNECELLIFGAKKIEGLHDVPFKTHYWGHLYDEVSVMLLYNAADVMVVPSRQEVFGQTASEALACGTPVAAFGIGGLSDIVDHEQNGYLAGPYDTEELAHGIMWCLERAGSTIGSTIGSTMDSTGLRTKAREKAEKAYGLGRIADRYIELYRSL